MNQQPWLIPPDDARPFARTGRPPEPIARAATISGQFRFSLSRRWGPGPLVFWAMLNPSIADAQRDDPTLLRIMGFSWRWGFAGLIVGNWYPYRASRPADLWHWRQTDGAGWSAHGASQRNRETCLEALDSCALHMAAWGAGPRIPSDGHWLIEASDRWHCLGITADGAPMHPLARGVHRVPDQAQPMRWAQP